jgi:hypothetical protein
MKIKPTKNEKYNIIAKLLLCYEVTSFPESISHERQKKM